MADDHYLPSYAVMSAEMTPGEVGHCTESRPTELESPWLSHTSGVHVLCDIVVSVVCTGPPVWWSLLVMVKVDHLGCAVVNLNIVSNLAGNTAEMVMF